MHPLSDVSRLHSRAERPQPHKLIGSTCDEYSSSSSRYNAPLASEFYRVIDLTVEYAWHERDFKRVLFPYLSGPTDSPVPLARRQPLNLLLRRFLPAATIAQEAKAFGVEIPKLPDFDAVFAVACDLFRAKAQKEASLLNKLTGHIVGARGVEQQLITFITTDTKVQPSGSVPVTPQAYRIRPLSSQL
ncbi:unnamed protein product [Parajaminaea phylloscopi]